MVMHLEIKRIADAALMDADKLLADWLPGGTRKGNEYWPINLVRDDREPGSFSINLHSGVWHDFASGDKGGDLVSLLAYLRGCRQIDAARMLAQQLGIAFGDEHKRDLLQEEAERQRLVHRREQRRQQAEAKRQAGWDSVAVRASGQWRKAVPADPQHPYIVRISVNVTERFANT